MVGILLLVVILVYLAASVAWSVFLRRFRKTRVRFFGVLASFVLSLVGAIITKSVLSGSDFAQGTLLPLIESNVSKEIAELLSGSPALLETIVGCAIALIVPLAMLVLFLVLNFFAWIVYLLIMLMRGAEMKEKDQEEEEKPVYQLPLTIAMAVVQSLLVVIVWMVPIATYANLVPPVLNELTEAQIMDDNTQSVLETVQKDYVEPINQNAGVVVFRMIGVSPISDMLTNFTVKGEPIRMTDELGALTSLVCNVVRLGGSSFAEYGDEELATFDKITASFERSNLLPIIVSEIVHQATDAWKNDEEFIGVGSDVIRFDESGMFDGFTTTLIDVVHEDTAPGKTDAIRADLITIADLIEVLIKENVFDALENEDDMIETLAVDGVIEDMIVVLGSNDSMKILIPEITNIGVRAIGSTLGIKADNEAVYDELMTSVANGLNEVRYSDDRVAAVTELLRAEFDDAGVIIEKSVVGFFAEAMVSDLLDSAGGRALDTDDVRAFFAVYAWSAENSSNSLEQSNDSTHTLAGTGKMTESAMRDLIRGTVYEGKHIGQLKNSSAAALVETVRGKSASAVLLTKGLYSADTMTSILVTIDELTLDPSSASEKINSYTVNTEAKAISSIFATAQKVLEETAESEELELEAVSDAIGEILDSLVASPTYGKRMVSNLFTAILQSELVRDAAMMDIKTATNLARRGSEGDDVNYKDTFKALAQTVAVMDSMNKNSGKLEDTEIVKLIETINPQSAGMIEEYVTPERMEEDYKMEKKQSEVAAPLISNTFGYLGNNDVEDYDKEAKAVNNVMSITMAARDNASDPDHNKSLLGDNGVLADQGDTAAERAANIIESLMVSSAVKYSLDETEIEVDPFELSVFMERSKTDDEVELMKTAISNYYNTPGNKTEQNKQDLLNVAKLFGLTGVEEILV